MKLETMAPAAAALSLQSSTSSGIDAATVMNEANRSTRARQTTRMRATLRVAAARRLNLTQPAVSLQVRELERRLGVRLIERVGRRARPSAAGTDLLEHAARIDTVVAGALDAVAGHREGGGGRVRLATGATACTYLLPGVLPGLRRQWPALEIIVSTGNIPEVLRAVEENTVDAALVTLPAPGRAFTVTPICDDQLVAVFAKREAEALSSPRLFAAAVSGHERGP